MYDLNGLSSASPICSMAAMGLLRVLTEDRGKDVRLGWKNGHAVLDGMDADEALEELVAAMDRRAEAPEFNWTDTARGMTATVYREQCEAMGSDSRALSFMAAWGTDAVLNDGKISTSRLDLTSGQQKLIRDLRKLATELKEETIARAAFRSALLSGPYDAQPSFGWDPLAVRSHAHEHRAPSKTAAPGKRGLVWLAAEALPLHPVIPITSSRAQTLGCDGYAAFVWPAWDALLSIDEIRLIRTLPAEKLHKRPGITEVWRSRFGKSGKYGMLFPAVREH